jgi:ketosteroid isomerase-like protein
MDEHAAIERVQSYLRLMEQRDLEAAQEALADNVEIVFPGPARFDSAAAIAAGGGRRYKNIRKTFGTTEAYRAPDGMVRVIQQGTLSGENLHGKPFSGVRYVDMFLVKDGKILRQDVFNDLAESGVLDARE